MDGAEFMERGEMKKFNWHRVLFIGGISFTVGYIVSSLLENIFAGYLSAFLLTSYFYYFEVVKK